MFKWKNGMVQEKWNKISHVVSALVCLHASMKLVHLHLTMVHYRACQWRKYLRETDMLKIKAFLGKKKIPIVSLKKMGPGHTKWELGMQTPLQWDILTGHWATLKAGSASQHTGPPVGTEWDLYASVPTSPSHSLEKNGGRSSNGHVYSWRFYIFLRKIVTG